MRFPSISHVGRFVAAVLATGLTSLSAGAASYTLVDLGRFRFPVAVNDHDDVAANGTKERVLLWRDDRWHLLKRLNGSARAINAHGDVVGDNLVMPRLWRHGEPGRQLPLPDGGTFGGATGINDALTVVGDYNADDETGRCFRWTADGGSIDLGFMADGHLCDAS